ncbi:hypothetical protein MTO96_013708 [Rhipicephalus appendiculatus]
MSCFYLRGRTGAFCLLFPWSTVLVRTDLQLQLLGQADSEKKWRKKENSSDVYQSAALHHARPRTDKDACVCEAFYRGAARFAVPRRDVPSGTWIAERARMAKACRALPGKQPESTPVPFSGEGVYALAAVSTRNQQMKSSDVKFEISPAPSALVLMKTSERVCGRADGSRLEGHGRWLVA